MYAYVLITDSDIALFDLLSDFFFYLVNGSSISLFFQNFSEEFAFQISWPFTLYLPPNKGIPWISTWHPFLEQQQQ